VDERHLHAFAIEPLTADFPFARSRIVRRTERTVKKTGATTTESHYYLCSLPPEQYSPGQWLELIRGHWGGVEIRNHWRRDALLGENRSRSRNPNLLANVALIRSALLILLADKSPDDPLPQARERLACRPAQNLALFCS
jgi:predicted transposase YbfD/YdcC